MTDNILFIALVFSILAGGTAAIGSELMGSPGRAPAAMSAGARVTLPTIVVTGRRQTLTVIAADSVAAGAAHVQ